VPGAIGRWLYRRRVGARTQAGSPFAVVPVMKPHVRRGRVAKEKRIERARARASAPRKQAA